MHHTRIEPIFYKFKTSKKIGSSTNIYIQSLKKMRVQCTHGFVQPRLALWRTPEGRG